jgi:hypothetical protein
LILDPVENATVMGLSSETPWASLRFVSNVKM